MYGIYFTIIFVVRKTVKMSFATINYFTRTMFRGTSIHQYWTYDPEVNGSVLRRTLTSRLSINNWKKFESSKEREWAWGGTRQRKLWTCNKDSKNMVLFPILFPVGLNSCVKHAKTARTPFSTTWHPVHRQDWSILIYFLYRWDQTDQTWSVQSAWCAEDEALEIDYSVSRCEILLLAPGHKRQPNGVWKPWGAVDMSSKTASRSSTSLDECRRPESIWLNTSVEGKLNPDTKHFELHPLTRHFGLHRRCEWEKLLTGHRRSRASGHRWQWG